MSKQVYIDENGNEIQVSGTVNTADMMPMSGNDSTKVSEAIGSLSTLTTTVKSSLVGAVNEVNGKISSLVKVQTFTKTYSINANGVVNFDNSFITVPSGYSLGAVLEFTSGTGQVAVVSVRPNNTSAWAFELANTTSTAFSNRTFTITILFVKTTAF